MHTASSSVRKASNKLSLRRLSHIGLITAVWIAIYCGLRMIPVTRCEFLHYEPSAVTQEGIEFCETTVAYFLDIDSLNYPVELSLSMDPEITVGQPVAVKMAFTLAGDTLVLPHELAITHTQRVHLLVIDSSLRDYHHIHPRPIELSGQWAWTFTPQRSEIYKVFAEIVPLRTRRKVVAVGEITVPGKGSEAPAMEPTLRTSLAGYAFELKVEPNELTIWQEHRMTLIVRNLKQDTVSLQPVMGAYGHIVAFDHERRGLAHLHPLSDKKPTDPVTPEIPFIFNTGKPGPYRLWAQVKLDARELFIPFDLTVKAL